MVSFIYALFEWPYVLFGTASYHSWFQLLKKNTWLRFTSTTQMNDRIVLCSIELISFALGKGDDEAKFPFRSPLLCLY